MTRLVSEARPAPAPHTADVIAGRDTAVDGRLHVVAMLPTSLRTRLGAALRVGGGRHVLVRRDDLGALAHAVAWGVPAIAVVDPLYCNNAPDVTRRVANSSRLATFVPYAELTPPAA